jgi:hypothetical protein
LSDPVDVLKLRKGRKIIIKGGEVLIVQGAYMSSDGVTITAKDSPASIVARNVPLEQIESVIEG